MQDESFERFAALLGGTPQMRGAWREFVAAAKATGRAAEAISLCTRLYDADPTLVRPLQALLHLVSDEPESRAPAPVEDESGRRPISIIACSNDDAQYTAMAASYDRALADWPHDFVRIADARSLAEGYNRGASRAAGEVLIFTHDDVEILPYDFGRRLARHFAECDILGIAGATRATGPAWPYAGWPFLHGAVIYPDGDGYRVATYSRTIPIAHGIRVMDGVFLAMEHGIASRIGWDEETCDGFHGYDVDFTLRAAQAGLRLAVASNLGVVHRSYGSFDDRWESTARKLVARHPELRGECGAETGPVARSVPSAQHALALVDNWARMGKPA